MNVVLVSLILLFIVAFSGIVARFVPVKIPLPLFQITLGAILASPLFNLEINLDPEVFLLLIIPPLLFSDAWRMSKQEFFKLYRPIFALALGLVLFTTVGVGYFIHWLIPVISLPMAFALGAVLSPTDAVAVAAISGRGKLPPRLQHILEGEALMNDATGLVAFKFAILAAVTGHFSLSQAGTSFIIIAAGGIIVGVGISLIAGITYNYLGRFSEEEPGIQVILLLLIPFAAYLVADYLNVSGILAAVGAGMAMSYTPFFMKATTATRLSGQSVLALLEFVFNGMSFVLLGLQLPGILELTKIEQRQAGNVSVWHLVFYVVAITLALIVLRFVWVWVTSRIRAFNFFKSHNKNSTTMPPLRSLFAATFAGVRGAITLAGVMSIPLFTSTGEHFPRRELLIFLAMGVILFSLIIGSIMLPIIIRGFDINQQTPINKEHKFAKSEIARAAIESIEEYKANALASDNQEYSDNEHHLTILLEVADSLIIMYQKHVNVHDNSDPHDINASILHNYETSLRLIAIRAERKELYQLHRNKKITDPVLRELLLDADLREAWLSSRKI